MTRAADTDIGVACKMSSARARSGSIRTSSPLLPFVSIDKKPPSDSFEAPPPEEWGEEGGEAAVILFRGRNSTVYVCLAREEDRRGKKMALRSI